MENWDYGRINRWGCTVDQPEPCKDFGIVVFSRRHLWLWRAVGFVVAGVSGRSSSLARRTRCPT